MQPDVSVVIPTYNRRELVEEAIESCFLGNESLEIEVIVVDDGSTDGTREYLRSLKNDQVRPILQEHQGPQVARNRGLRAAEGDFIKFLDSDDLLVEGVLVDEVERLSQTGSDVAYGDLLHVDLQTGERGRTACNEVEEDLLSGIFRGKVLTIPPVFLYRRELIEEAEWDPGIPYHQDTAFAIDVASRCPESVYTNCTVAIHRRHLDGNRVSASKQSAPDIERLHLQTQLIKRGIEHLRGVEQVLNHHRQAAADGLWKWAHMISVYDWDTFRGVYKEINKLSPNYKPKRRYNTLRIIDDIIGPLRTEFLLLPFRRLKKNFIGG